MCPKCNEVRPADWFNRHKKQCKSCRAAIERAYVARNRERVYRRSKAWRDAGGRRKSKIESYGITVEQYDGMLEQQGGVCAICKEACPPGRELAVDHCHSTGRVRGLLCTKCNPMLGFARDDIAVLEAAIAYLRS